jgi:hypothetical protein
MSSTFTRKRRRFPRTAAAAAAGLAVALLPLGAASTHAATPAEETRQLLPPGVIKLNDSEPCPPATLCLYRDYGFSGPAYGIGAGYTVHLEALPMEGGVHGPTAANEVSSWVNNTGSVAVLVDTDDEVTRPLFPGQRLQEPPPFNDTVNLVSWSS